MKAIGGSVQSLSITILSLLLMAAGSFFVYQANMAHARSVQPVLPSTSSTILTSSQSPQPVTLTIPSVDIAMDVKVGHFDPQAGQWELNEKDAFYAAGSATPIIYAHNRNGMFANLKDVSKGGVLTLGYKDGSRKDYLYSDTRFVAPDNASVLNEKNESTVILLTCEGWFSESRRLTYFTEIRT